NFGGMPPLSEYPLRQNRLNSVDNGVGPTSHNPFDGDGTFSLDPESSTPHTFSVPSPSTPTRRTSSMTDLSLYSGSAQATTFTNDQLWTESQATSQPSHTESCPPLSEQWYFPEDGNTHDPLGGPFTNSSMFL